MNRFLCLTVRMRSFLCRINLKTAQLNWEIYVHTVCFKLANSNTQSRSDKACIAQIQYESIIFVLLGRHLQFVFYVKNNDILKKEDECKKRRSQHAIFIPSAIHFLRLKERNPELPICRGKARITKLYDSIICTPVMFLM